MSLPPSRPIRASGAALIICILFLGSSPRSSSAAVRLALVVPPSARSPRHPFTLRRALAGWATSDSAASPSSVVSVRPSTVGGGGGLFLSSTSRPIPPGGTVATVPDCRIITYEDAVGDAHYGAEFAALTAAGGAGGRKAALVGFLAKEWLWWDYRRRNRTGGGERWGAARGTSISTSSPAGRRGTARSICYGGTGPPWTGCSGGASDQLEAAGICLLPPLAVDLQGFVACVGARVRGVQIQILTEGQARVGAVLQDLVEPELMAQAFWSGFSERGARVRFNSI